MLKCTWMYLFAFPYLFVPGYSYRQTKFSLSFLFLLIMWVLRNFYLAIFYFIVGVSSVAEKMDTHTSALWLSATYVNVLTRHHPVQISFHHGTGFSTIEGVVCMYLVGVRAGYVEGDQDSSHLSELLCS